MRDVRNRKPLQYQTGEPTQALVRANWKESMSEWHDPQANKYNVVILGISNGSNPTHPMITRLGIKAYGLMGIFFRLGISRIFARKLEITYV